VSIAICSVLRQQSAGYFQLIHGSSASCGGNKPHVQWSTKEGITVTCPRRLRMVEYYTQSGR
jgi:hypothetical protein